MFINLISNYAFSVGANIFKVYIDLAITELYS